MSVDTEHRRLCHALLDAIEQGDTRAVDACYAPDMTMWCNFTGEEITREVSQRLESSEWPIRIATAIPGRRSRFAAVWWRLLGGRMGHSMSALGKGSREK